MTRLLRTALYVAATGLTLLTLVALIATAQADFGPAPLPRNHQLITSGRDWQLVFVGNLHCWPSNKPDLRDAVRSILLATNRDVVAARESFSTLGVATDETESDGRRFLEQYGTFDETSVGRGWLNQSVIRLMWRDQPGHAITPSLLLVTRSVEIDSAQHYVIGVDSVALRLAGTDAILAYARYLNRSQPAAPH